MDRFSGSSARNQPKGALVGFYENKCEQETNANQFWQGEAKRMAGVIVQMEDAKQDLENVHALDEEEKKRLLQQVDELRSKCETVVIQKQSESALLEEENKRLRRT